MELNPNSHNPAGPRTLLVVDDDLDVGRIIARAARKRGHVVIMAEDGQQAMAMLDEHDIDLMFVDAVMPRIDGFQLLEHVRHHCARELPTVMVSGKSHAIDRLRGYQAGADFFLPKPFRQQEILDLVDYYCGSGGSEDGLDDAETRLLF
jgi:DNA-binding response OmpR family regulator